jgi:hypothetical protein
MIRRRTLLGTGLTVPALGAFAALAIKYDRVVHSGLDDTFDVRVTLSRPDAAPLSGTRTVVAAYPNNAPEFSEPGAARPVRHPRLAVRPVSRRWGWPQRAAAGSGRVQDGTDTRVPGSVEFRAGGTARDPSAPADG